MNRKQQPQQLELQPRKISDVGSVYDEIVDYYDDLVDIDKEASDMYDNPDADPGHAAEPNPYQPMYAASEKPISSTECPVYLALIDDETAETCDV